MLKTAAMLIGLAMLTATGGCSSGNIYQPETALDRNWGRSYESAKYNQIMNPDAGKTPQAVADKDGVASDNTVHSYQDSFLKQKDQKVTNILKLQ